MKLTLKTVVIGLAGVALLFFFLPYLSIGGASTSIGAFVFSGLSGYSDYGIVFASFGLIPLAIAGLWLFLKDPGKVKVKGIISACLAGLLVIFHFLFLFNEFLSKLDKTLFFWLGIIVQLVIAIISLMVAFGKASEDETDLKGFANAALEEGKNAAQNAKQNAQNVAQSAQAAGKNFAENYQKNVAASSAGKTCPSCGAEMDADSVFCMECGAKYVAPAKEGGDSIDLSKVKMCINCGNILDEDELFCPMCGTKYEDRVCPNCGAKIKKGASFCGKCGTNYYGG